MAFRSTFRHSFVVEISWFLNQFTPLQTYNDLRPKNTKCLQRFHLKFKQTWTYSKQTLVLTNLALKFNFSQSPNPNPATKHSLESLGSNLHNHPNITKIHQAQPKLHPLQIEWETHPKTLKSSKPRNSSLTSGSILSNSRPNYHSQPQIRPPSKGPHLNT